MPSKTIGNCLCNDICYLVIGCFDWKIVVFPQTVVRGLLLPKKKKKLHVFLDGGIERDNHKVSVFKVWF